MNYNFDKTCYNLLLRNYPQYEVLRQELLKLFYRKALANGITVDCYVNLNSYLSSLYKRTEYIYDEPMSICASIVNFAAHIREFFASRFSISTRIFLVYGATRSDNTIRYLPDYDAHNQMDREVKSIHININEDLALLNILAPYIPQVYYVNNQDTEPAVLIREIIKQESNSGRKFPRIIFSKDLYDYQLIATCPNTHLVRTKKTMQGDQTYTASFFDFYKKFNKTIKIKNPIGEGVSPELYSIYMTLAGCKDRGIRSLINYPRTDNLIKDRINTGLLLNGYNPSFGVNPESFKMFVESEDQNDSTYLLLYNRFCAMDIIHQSHLFELTPSYSSLYKNIVDLYDPDSVRQINNQYFKKYPLDLNVF